MNQSKVLLARYHLPPPLALLKELALRKVVQSKQNHLLNKFLLPAARRITQQKPKPGLTVLAYLQPAVAAQLHIQ